MFDRLLTYLPTLLAGVQVTVTVTVFAILLAVALAVPAGLGRMSSHLPVRLIAGAFIEFFRGTSALVQLYWIFFALPLAGISLSPITAGVVALGCNVGAYGAEVVRTGFLAVPRGQGDAATSLNLPAWSRFWDITLPQAIPIMIPPFNNLFIQLLKGTSLVSLITLADITYQAKLVRTETGDSALVFGIALVIYFVLSLLITAAMRLLNRAVSFPGLGERGAR